MKTAEDDNIHINSQIVAKSFSSIKTTKSIKTMNTAIILSACLFVTGIKATSDFKDDAQAILRVLNNNINNIDQLSKCYNTVYQGNGTIQNKRNCLAILAKISKPRNNRSSVQQRSKSRSSTPMNSRRQCRRFHRWGC